MKQKTKIDLFIIGYVALLALLAVGFFLWHESIHGDSKLFAALFCIYGVGSILYIVSSCSRHTLWLVPLDALILFLLLQISLSIIYWAVIVLTVVNALLVKLFVKDSNFDTIDSVVGNVVGYIVGYLCFFFVTAAMPS